MGGLRIGGWTVYRLVIFCENIYICRHMNNSKKKELIFKFSIQMVNILGAIIPFVSNEWQRMKFYE